MNCTEVFLLFIKKTEIYIRILSSDKPFFYIPKLEIEGIDPRQLCYLVTQPGSEL